VYKYPPIARPKYTRFSLTTYACVLCKGRGGSPRRFPLTLPRRPKWIPPLATRRERQDRRQRRPATLFPHHFADVRSSAGWDAWTGLTQRALVLLIQSYSCLKSISCVALSDHFLLEEIWTEYLDAAIYKNDRATCVTR
jgi:hypothetical protein